MQALREWPEHEPAREGLREVLVMAVENELARESLRTARARLAELDDPPASLRAAVESLEAKHAAEREQQARLIALERDLDLSVASSERRAFIGAVLAVAVAARRARESARATPRAGERTMARALRAGESRRRPSTRPEAPAPT